MPKLLVILSGGLIDSIWSDEPGVEIRVLNTDREDELSEDTASFLRENRDVLRPARLGEACDVYLSNARNSYMVRHDLYPHPVTGW